LKGMEFRERSAAKSQDDRYVIFDARFFQEVQLDDHVHGGHTLALFQKDGVAAAFQSDMESGKPHPAKGGEFLIRLSSNVVDSRIHGKLVDIRHERVGHVENSA